MKKAEDDNTNTEVEEQDYLARIKSLERENRKLARSVKHLENAIAQEKIAYTTVLNRQKASTYVGRTRERYLMLLLANSPSIIIFLGETGRIEFCTEYFVKKVMKSSASDIMGHTLSDVLAGFMDEEQLRSIMNLSNQVIQSNATHTFDATFCFDQITEEEFAGLMVPMKDNEQRSDGVMLMLHDITDLNRSRLEALAASKAKSDFLSNMSHEIRTPMNAIIGMTSIGRAATSLERKNYTLDRIESASIHLLGVINDILDISKIESGKMELDCTTFSFSQMIDRVMSVISQRLEEKHLHFSYTRDPELPDTLYGDDHRLAQVITNILSNAAKFTPEKGSITLQVQVESRDEHSCLIQISAKDTGIGMSEKEQAQVFQAFQQAESDTTRKFGGTGLGLAISKSFVEMMNGEIWLESEPGKGSTFFFTAKLGIAEQEIPVEGVEISGDQEEFVPCGAYADKVMLLVDDIDINLEILSALLEPTGITIDTAHNGQEAFDLFTANPSRYDVIMMDVQMPEVDGLQATCMIRAFDAPEASTVPIIAMTANVFREDIDLCLAAGMNNHLGKPVSMDAVLKLLNQYLSAD